MEDLPKAETVGASSKSSIDVADAAIFLGKFLQKHDEVLSKMNKKIETVDESAVNESITKMSATSNVANEESEIANKDIDTVREEILMRLQSVLTAMKNYGSLNKIKSLNVEKEKISIKKPMKESVSVKSETETEMTPKQRSKQEKKEMKSARKLEKEKKKAARKAEKEKKKVAKAEKKERKRKRRSNEVSGNSDGMQVVKMEENDVEIDHKKKKRKTAMIHSAEKKSTKKVRIKDEMS